MCQQWPLSVPRKRQTPPLQARRLALALDAIEAELARLSLGADPDAIVDALASPIRAFDAAAKEAPDGRNRRCASSAQEFASTARRARSAGCATWRRLLEARLAGFSGDADGLRRLVLTALSLLDEAQAAAPRWRGRTSEIERLNDMLAETKPDRQPAAPAPRKRGARAVAALSRARCAEAPLETKRATRLDLAAGGFCGVREALSSQGPYHLSRELALFRTVVWSTWRPPSSVRVREDEHSSRRMWFRPTFFSPHARSETHDATQTSKPQKADAPHATCARERAARDAGDAALKLIEHFPLELARLSPVAGYWPVGGEIDARPLLAALAKAGRDDRAAAHGDPRRPGALLRLARRRSAQAPTRSACPRRRRPARSSRRAHPHAAAGVRPRRPPPRAGRRALRPHHLALSRPRRGRRWVLPTPSRKWSACPPARTTPRLDWVITPKEAIRCRRRRLARPRLDQSYSFGSGVYSAPCARPHRISKRSYATFAPTRSPMPTLTIWLIHA